MIEYPFIETEVRALSLRFLKESFILVPKLGILQQLEYFDAKDNDIAGIGNPNAVGSHQSDIVRLRNASLKKILVHSIFDALGGHIGVVWEDRAYKKTDPAKFREYMIMLFRRFR